MAPFERLAMAESRRAPATGGREQRGREKALAGAREGERKVREGAREQPCAQPSPRLLPPSRGPRLCRWWRRRAGGAAAGKGDGGRRRGREQTGR
jgi:hypothetical protein